MRYYCYYCWVSETYARSGSSDDCETWRSWLRRAEALYALGAAYVEETGVGGTEWANRRLATDKKVIDFAAAASIDRSQQLYLRQSLGVFGGAYFSQMEEMGLFTYNKHGIRSEEHTSELQSPMSISYAFFCLKKKTIPTDTTHIVQ